MRRFILIGLVALLAGLVWSGVFLFGTLEGWWRRPLAARGDANGFMAGAARMIEEGRPGNLGMALIEDGRVHETRYVSIGEPVNSDTLFQVASLSKWVTALGVMTLVEAGKVDLDAPVDRYLKRWHLPAGEFDANEVTVRRILSHTAGLTDGLGYAGFAPGQPIDSLPQSLTRATDASPGRDGMVRVGARPGGEWDYSGGGYTLLQLMIEDVTGESFDAYMTRAVMRPLGMRRSTFLTPEADPNLAQFWDEGGKPAVHYRFTATGAASLYTSVGDLTRLIQAHLTGPNGEPPGRGVLRPATLELMRKPHAFQLGADFWGLGLILYAPNNQGGHVVGHDGDNEPAINTAARFDPATGNGIVVLQTGNTNLATRIAGEWVFWSTGKVDTFVLVTEANRTLTILAIGWAVILVGAAITGWRLRRRRPAGAGQAG